MKDSEENNPSETSESKYDVKKYKAEKAIRKKYKRYGPVIVKGRLRDDKRVKTYSITIPAPIRTQLELTGEEYFLVKVKKDEIILKVIATPETEEESEEETGE